MFIYKIRRNDKNDWLEIKCINSQNTVIQKPLFTSELKSATPESTFTLINRNNYNECISYILGAMEDGVKIHGVIYDDNVIIASGYIDTASLSIQSSMIAESISLTIVDYITDLDIKITQNFVADKDDIGYLETSGISVIDAINKLLEFAGLEQRVTYSSTKYIPHFVLTEDDNCTYREKIDKILFEYPGLVLYRNPNTNTYEIKKIDFSLPENPRKINYLVKNKLKTTHKIFDQDGIQVQYPTVETKSNTEVYIADISHNLDSSTGLYTGLIITPESYYPENGDVQAIYMEYKKDLFDRPYKDKTSRVQNADLDLYYVRNPRIEFRADGELTLLTTEQIPALIKELGLTINPSFYPRKVWALYYNGTDKDINLDRFAIIGDATYRTKINKMTLPYDSKAPLEYESDYIFTEGHAKEFASFYYNFKTISSTISTWTEIEDSLNPSYLGETVLIQHKGTNTAQAHIICQIDDLSLEGNIRCKNITAIAISGFDDYIIKNEGFIQSQTGKRILEQINEYYLSTSGEELVDGTWVDHYITDSSKYLWTRIITTYSNGSKEYGDAYLISSPISINTVTIAIYKSTENQPSLPNEVLKYNFETTEIIGDLQGWTRYIPTNKGKIWVSVATLRSRSNEVYINTSDWSEVSLLAENGVDILIQYCWSRYDDIAPKEQQIVYGDFDVLFEEKEIWIDLYANDHSIVPPSDNDTYLWMRTSGDNGVTWTYSMITGNAAKNFNLIVSPISYNLRRGSVLSPITVNAFIERYNTTGVATWSCDIEGVITSSNIHAENISFIIPKGFKKESITLQVSVVGVSYIKTFKINGLFFESSYKYLGKIDSINSIPTETDEGPLIDNDCFLYVGETEGSFSKNLIYIYDSSINSFRVLNSSDSKYSEIVALCQADVWSIVPEDSVIAAQWGYIKNLIVQRLNIIEDLFHAKINKTDGVDIKYNNKSIFKISPENGYVFIGKPNSEMSEPEYGFMFNTSKNELITKNGGFTISEEGKLITNYMVAESAEIANSKITNGYFSGYFDCVAIKAQPDNMVLYKSATAYSSQEISSCYNVLSDLNFLGVDTSSTKQGNNYSPLYSCSVSTQSTDYPNSIPILSSIKYIRVLRYFKYFANSSMDILAIEFFDANLNFISADSSNGLATSSKNYSELDIWNYSAAIDRIFSLRFFPSKSVKAGRWFLFDVNISIYTGGNKLVVNIPGINSAVDPSSITEKGRLYVDANGFVKAKI